MTTPPKKRKTFTTAERLKKLEQIVKRQEQKIKELEKEVRRIDMEEITKIPKLNIPLSQ